MSLQKLLALAKSRCFSFNDQLHQQCDGLAMGKLTLLSPFSRGLENNFMGRSRALFDFC